MKRILLICTLIIASSWHLMAQVVLNEDFSSGTFPPAGWTISAQSANWAAVPTAHAGGQAPEVRMNWTPQFNGTTMLITPSLDLSANETGLMSVTFKHMVDHYGSTYNIGFSYRVAQGNWITLWGKNVTGSIPAESVTIVMDDSYPVNNNDLQFAFFFTGNSYNINYWYIDDVTASIPGEFDLALTEILVPDFVIEDMPVSGIVANLGAQPILSFDLNWQVDGGAVVTESFTGLDIAFGSNYVFESQALLSEAPGEYLLEVFLTNINGELADDNADNDLAEKNFNVPFGSVDRRPLFESFTSSTCPPCASFNLGFFNNFIDENFDNIAIIKYQMNWPGSGDPYYTAEGGVRRNYYGVTSVPSLVIDGTMIAPSAAGVNAAMAASLAKPAFFDLSGTSIVDGQTVLLDVAIMPYLNVNGVKLHAAVLEKKTTGNVGSNGETEFHYVMMKMIPNALGSDINLVALNEFTADFVVDLSGTFVEEFDDLTVVLFLQNNTTQEVYQSAVTEHSLGFTVNFSIEDLSDNIDVDPQVEITFYQPVSQLDGSEITNENVAELISFFEVERSRNPVAFTATISEDKKSILIEADATLSFLTQYTVELQAILSESGLSSDPASVTFTTRASMGAPVAEFDVIDESINIPVNHSFTITFNQAIRHLDGSTITNDDANVVVMFYEEGMEGEPVAFTASINDDKTILTINANDELKRNQLYLLGVEAVLGDEMSEPVSITFTSEEGLNINNLFEKGLKIYPNPASTELFVELPAATNAVQLRIFDISGQVVYTASNNAQLVRINLNEIASGVYFVELQSDNVLVRRKLIITK